jgi:hypothetical protein
MNRAGGNVVVMIVVPWALIWLLRSTGRRWGTGSAVSAARASATAAGRAHRARRPSRRRRNRSMRRLSTVADPILTGGSAYP